MTSLADVFEGRERWHVEPCDCRFGMSCMPSDSVDAMVTDPPAGIKFMGRAWDDNKGGRDKWIDWLATIMREAFRVLKPGAHALVWALPRTSHWTATAIEDAGFEVRDVLVHLFATGFPKSSNVSKLIDARNGDQRPVLGQARGAASANTNSLGAFAPEYDVTSAASAASAAWDGWGTALKPASEHWILARKPLGGTIAECVLKNGTGAINIDGCRIACAPDDAEKLAAGVESIRARGGSMENSWKNSSDLSGANPASPLGRWPSNVLLSHSDECKRIELASVKRAGGDIAGAGAAARRNDIYGSDARPRGDWKAYGNDDGTETVERYDCVANCPVRLLDEQSGDRPGMSGGGEHRSDYAGGMFGAIDCSGTARKDSGGASRFYFTSKASRAEKDAGLDDFEPATAGEATGRADGTDGLKSPRAGAGRTGGAKNTHPTPKRVDLMRYLTRLVTPPKGLVIDPFCGSGSGGVAAVLEGMRFVGLELEPLHVDFARARIAHVIGGTWQREVKPERPVEKKQPSLFDAIGGAK